MKLSTILYTLGFASITASAANYLTGKAEAGTGGERNGLFIGQWAPTFFILAKVVEDREKANDLKLD